MSWPPPIAGAPSNPRMIDAADGCVFCVNLLPGGTATAPGVYQYGDAAHPADGSGDLAHQPSWKQVAASLTPKAQGSQTLYHVGAVSATSYGATLYLAIGLCQIGSPGDAVLDAGLVHYPVIIGKSTDGGVTWDFRGVGRGQGSGWVNDIDGPNVPAVPYYLVRDVTPAVNYDGVHEAGMALDGKAGNWTGIKQDPTDANRLMVSGRSSAWMTENLLSVFTGGTPVFYPVVRGIFGAEAHGAMWDKRANGYAYLGVSDWRLAYSTDGFTTDDHVWHTDPGGNDNVEALDQNAQTGRLYCGFNNSSGASGGLQSIADPAAHVPLTSADWTDEIAVGSVLYQALGVSTASVSGAQTTPGGGGSFTLHTSAMTGYPSSGTVKIGSVTLSYSAWVGTSMTVLAGSYSTGVSLPDGTTITLPGNAISGVCVLNDSSGQEVVIVAVRHGGIYRRVGRSGTWQAASSGLPDPLSGNVTIFDAIDDQSGRVAVFSKETGVWVSANYGDTWTLAYATSAGGTSAQGVVADPDGSTLYCVDTQHVTKITNAYTTPVTTSLTFNLADPGNLRGPLAITPDGSTLWIVNRGASGIPGYLMKMPTSGAGYGTWVEPPGRTRSPGDGLFQVMTIDVAADGRIIMALDGQGIRLGMLPGSPRAVDYATAYGGGFNNTLTIGQNGSGLIGADTGGSYQTHDHAHSWNPTGGSASSDDNIATADRNVCAVWYHPTVAGRCYKMTKAGTWQSDDDGLTWHDTMPTDTAAVPTGPKQNPSSGGGGHPRNVGQHCAFLADGSMIVGGQAGKLWKRSAALAVGSITNADWVHVDSPTTRDITGVVADQDGVTFYVADGVNIWGNGGGPPPSTSYQVQQDAMGGIVVTA